MVDFLRINKPGGNYCPCSHILKIQKEFAKLPLIYT